VYSQLFKEEINENQNNNLEQFIEVTFEINSQL